MTELERRTMLIACFESILLMSNATIADMTAVFAYLIHSTCSKTDDQLLEFTVTDIIKDSLVSLAESKENNQ